MPDTKPHTQNEFSGKTGSAENPGPQPDEAEKDTSSSAAAFDRLSSVEDILEDIRNGIPVIITDDENRENEGDLVIAAQMATPENINFMAKNGRGLICLPMAGHMIERLGLELMGRGDNTHHRTAFTVSIEAKEGITTGISASDRARTIQTAINPDTGPLDIATPGHVFQLVARDGGVLVRAGHTEAAVDLSVLAGFSGAGVICEIMNDDGSMARLPDLKRFAARHDLKIGTIADLISYRRKNEKLVHHVHQENYQSEFWGQFKLHVYASDINGFEHIALVKGDVRQSVTPVLVRMHAIDTIKDMLGQSATSGNAITKSMELIEQEGQGVIVILRDSDPVAISKRLGKLEDNSEDNGEHSIQNLRTYGLGAQILKDLGVNKMKLITNTPKTVVGLDGYGLEICEYCDLNYKD